MGIELEIANDIRSGLSHRFGVQSDRIDVRVHEASVAGSTRIEVSLDGAPIPEAWRRVLQEHFEAAGARILETGTGVRDVQ